MSTGKLLLLIVGAIVFAVLVGTLVSALFALIGLTMWIIRLTVTLFVLALIGYGGYRVYRWFQALVGSSSNETEQDVPWASEEPEPLRTGTRIDDIKKRYLAGELSQAEFERLVERELDEESGEDPH